MFKALDVITRNRNEFIDITGKVQEEIRHSGIQEGCCTLFVPHTTAGLMVNEGADPDVLTDLGEFLKRIAPQRTFTYRHSEGNSDAHIKAALVGCSQHLFIQNGILVLGTWQKVFFCEFDGPRSRRVMLQII